MATYILEPYGREFIHPFFIEYTPYRPPRGAGYLAGEFPGGTTTADGVPLSATVRVLLRKTGAGDGTLVAQTRSSADGTWRVDGLDPTAKYDVVGRSDNFNDVIVANVTPSI